MTFTNRKLYALTGTGFKQSDYAIINQNSEDPEFEIEKEFTIADARGLTMSLKLNYITYPEAGGAKKIQIYSSYVFMNKTGLPFNLVAPSWNGSHKEIAGNSLFAEDYTQPEPTPFCELIIETLAVPAGLMSSVELPPRRRQETKAFGGSEGFVLVEDDRFRTSFGRYGGADVYASGHRVSRRFLVRTRHGQGESMSMRRLRSELTHQYALTRVVTLAPRWFVVNNFEYPIRFRQEQTDKVYEMKAGGRLPLLETQNRAPLHLCFAADSSTLKWYSSPTFASLDLMHARWGKDAC